MYPTIVTNDKIVRTFVIGNLGRYPGFRLSSTSWPYGDVPEVCL